MIWAKCLCVFRSEPVQLSLNLERGLGNPPLGLGAWPLLFDSPPRPRFCALCVVSRPNSGYVVPLQNQQEAGTLSLRAAIKPCTAQPAQDPRDSPEDEEVEHPPPFPEPQPPDPHP